MRSSIFVIMLLAGSLQAGEPFAVVELFTSEGCSSCPSAEKYLNQMAVEARASSSRIYPLAFHVDYWDYLGWSDPFAQPAFSDRQRAYAKKVAPKQAYTPQMFVNGRSGFVGSDRAAGDLHIQRALKTQAVTTLELSNVTLTQGKLEVTWAADKTPKHSHLQIAVAASAPPHRIRRGENRGRDLAHANAVRVFQSQPLEPGASKGQITIQLPEDLPKTDRLLVIYVQNLDNMEISGAQATSF